MRDAVQVQLPLVDFTADDYYMYYNVRHREWFLLHPGDRIQTDKPLFLIRDYRYTLFTQELEKADV